ncbi:MAG: hypothetical protein ACJ8GW_10190 [Massilia sp.]
MAGLFKRAFANPAPDFASLGVSDLALPAPSGCAVPDGCLGLVIDKGGHTRRLAQHARIHLEAHERALCFHPGPYGADLLPFAAAPELGLRLSVTVDVPDPRVIQQRFDLYLASEAPDGVSLAAFSAALESSIQRELAQGNLGLPPCTTLVEWNAFRAGLNQLLYTRFGVIVDDCLPVDLGEQVDYAQILRARAVPASTSVAATVQAIARATPSDAEAMRRLFLELPCVMCGLRLAVLPPGQALFHQHQALLQRLDQVSLSVTTMPTLELAAPGVALAAEQQARRSSHAVAAVDALDEAWALLARLPLAEDHTLGILFDDADRIIANLELHVAGRRITNPESEFA